MKIVADADIAFVAKCFSSIGQVEVVSGREITSEVVADADILLVRSITRVDSELLAGSKVRFVGTATIGTDHIDIEYLSRNNIGFASAPGSNANSAAEYVIAALLEIGRRHSINLAGKSAGIIGVGNVGSRVARKCRALGMRIYLNDPPLQRQTGDPRYLAIEELFDCDFVTIHTPLTFEGPDRTFHLGDAGFFESLKGGCVFINTSRGGVVDSGALKEAIKSGRLQAAVLDVWEGEPNIDTGLLEMVDIGTPHIAGYSLDGKTAGMMMIYKAVCRYLGVEPRFDMEDFLPEPSVAELSIDVHNGSEQEVLLRTVKKIYDISEDDSKLRRILEERAEKRGEFFDSLRKNYPVRREFQNTKVLIATEGMGNKLKSKGILDKLAGLGFKVANARG